VDALLRRAEELDSRVRGGSALQARFRVQSVDVRDEVIAKLFPSRS
jgi:hypothetical protein